MAQQPQERATTEPLLTPPPRAGIVELGRLAVQHHLITVEQLKTALSHYRTEQRNGQRLTVRQLLVEGGYLDTDQFNHLLTLFKLSSGRPSTYRLGELALEQKWITAAQHHEAVAIQHQLFAQHQRAPLLGDILVKKGYLTAEQLEQLLDLQRQHDPHITPTLEELPAVASGEGETESPPPLTFELQVPQEGLECTLILFKPYLVADGLTILLQMLAQARVIYGLIDQERMRRIIRGEEGESGRWVIAKGREAVPGVEGHIDYFFDIDPLKAGTLKEGGVIDFKDRGEIPMVKEGERLAELTPPIPGEPGCTIFGKEIPPPQLNRIKLNAAKGVRLSADLLSAEAKIDGTPAVTPTGALYVFPVRHIEGDVGYETGHVHFDGDIQVEGSIANGFKVSGGRLTAKEVNAAEIEVCGDILIQGGIIGATVKCGGSLRAHFIHNADLQVAGDIIVDKEVIGSTLHSGGSFLGGRVTLLNTTLSTCGSIVVHDVGAEGGASSNRIQLGTCFQLNGEIESRNLLLKERQGEQQKIAVTLKTVLKEHHTLPTLLAAQVKLQEQARKAIQPLTAQYQALTPAEQKALGGGYKLEVQIAALEDTVVKAENQRLALLTRQEELEREIAVQKERLNTITRQIESIQSELTVLLEDRAQHSKWACLEIHGILYEYNQIQTPYKSFTTQTVVKRVLIKSVKREGGVEGSEQREVVMVPLRKKVR